MALATNPIWTQLGATEFFRWRVGPPPSLAAIRPSHSEELLEIATREGEEQQNAMYLIRFLAEPPALERGMLDSQGRKSTPRSEARFRREIRKIFPPRLQAEWTRIVPHLARKFFPSRAGACAFYVWRGLDQKKADRFMTRFNPAAGKWTEEQWLAIVMALAQAKALKTLKALPRLPPLAESNRQSAVRGMRGITPQELGALTRQWRRTRSGQALARLIHEYMRAKGWSNVRLEDLRRVLGKPTTEEPDEEPHYLMYETNDGYSVQFWAQEEGVTFKESD